MPVDRDSVRYLADGVFQVGYVVPDLDAAQAFFVERMGSGEFMTIREAPITDRVFRGAPTPGALEHVSFAYVGDLQVEVIQPVAGRNSYSEFLEANPQGGLHHVGTRTDDYDRAIADLGGEQAVVHSGSFGDTRFAYLDGGPLGALMEIIYTQEMFANLREQSR
jgi:methylmalonyl-CoA/ethylmalonyl-CoA epimerase